MQATQHCTTSRTQIKVTLLLTYFKLSLYPLAARLSVFDLLHAVIFHYLNEPREQCTMLSRNTPNYCSDQSFKQRSSVTQCFNNNGSSLEWYLECKTHSNNLGTFPSGELWETRLNLSKHGQMAPLTKSTSSVSL